MSAWEVVDAGWLHDGLRLRLSSAAQRRLEERRRLRSVFVNVTARDGTPTPRFVTGDRSGVRLTAHAPDAERRGRARLALAAAGDLEQAAWFRARLVSDAPADVTVVVAALALAALGDVGSLDGVRAVAARHERVRWP